MSQTEENTTINPQTTDLQPVSPQPEKQMTRLDVVQAFFEQHFREGFGLAANELLGILAQVLDKEQAIRLFKHLLKGLNTDTLLYPIIQEKVDSMLKLDEQLVFVGEDSTLVSSEQVEAAIVATPKKRGRKKMS